MIMVLVAILYKPAYEFIKNNVDAYMILDLAVTCALRYVTKDKARFI